MKKARLAAMTVCLGLSVPGRAQLSQDQTKAFPVTPPAGKSWTAVKGFAYAGDYLYKSTDHRYPTKNIYLTGSSYNDYDYFLFGGVRGKHLYISVAYDGTTPTTQGGCEHTHLNYGAKGLYTVQYAGYTYQGWSWIGGGTQSGNWNAATNTCRRSVVNGLSKTIPLFGWGVDYIDALGSSFANGTARYIDNVVFVVAAPTHSVGDCDPVYNPASGISFKACLDAAYVYAYTTNL
jgi:hypothetical protein